MRLKSILLLTHRPYFFTSAIKPQANTNITNNPKLIKNKYSNYSHTTTGRIITQLSKSKIDFNHIQNILIQLSNRLQKTVQDNPNDFLELMNILSLLSSKHHQKLKRHKIIMVQCINKFFNIIQIEAECLQNYIQAQKEYRMTIKQKSKSSRMLCNLLMTVHQNLDKLHPKYFVYIFEILLNDQIQSIKFTKIAKNLLEFCTPFFKKQKSYEGNMAQLIQKVSSIYRKYGISNTQQFQIFYQYLIHTFIALKKLSKITENDLNTLSVIFMNFNYQIKDSQGRHYKTLLADQLVDFFSLKQYKISKHRYKFCSALVNYYFYLHSTNFPMIQQGSIRYLPKNSLGPRPQLPQIFWKIYGQNPQLLNYVSYMKCIIKGIYPQKFHSTSGISNKTIPPFLETEMKIRVEQSLIQLGIKYQSEVEISGRYIDFLLDGNIILEVDGTFHIDVNKLEFDDVTQSRNVHLIYAGYRLVSINIYQYNVAREINDLQELISAKLHILKENDCVFVI